MADTFTKDAATARDEKKTREETASMVRVRISIVARAVANGTWRGVASEHRLARQWGVSRSDVMGYHRAAVAAMKAAA